MAIYRTGQASMDAQGYITGYDTKWREQLTLIRPGATIFFIDAPFQAAVISEVISDTQIRAITTGGAEIGRSNYIILLHDSITVDGLAQDVAETLRYYQSKETQIEEAIEFFKNFDLKQLQDLANQVKGDAEKTANDRAATEQLKNDTQQIKDSAVAETNQIKADTNEIKAQTQQIKDSAITEVNSARDQGVLAVNQTKDQAVTDINQIKNETSNIRDEAKNALIGAESARDSAIVYANDANNAKAGAETARDDARQWAQQVNPENLLHKNQNLNDVQDKGAARTALDVPAKSESFLIENNLSEIADRTTAWLNVRPQGSTPLAGDPVNDYDAATKRWVQNMINTGTVGPTMNGVMNYGVGDFHLRDSRAYIQPYEVVSDGQLLNRADWPELWAYAQMLTPISDADWLANPAKRGKYSTGDGETTFRVPDRNGVQVDSISCLYGRGDGADSSVNGFVYDSAAPNITGYIGGVIAYGAGGAFRYYQSKPPVRDATAGTGYGIQLVDIDANRSSPIYGRSDNEIMGRNFVGVWVIRASGGFVAANTSWSVINGDASMPAEGTTVDGGNVCSLYKVNNVTEAEANFRTRADIGGNYYASISVKNSTTQRSAALDFDETGTLRIPNNIVVDSSNSCFADNLIVARAAYPHIAFQPRYVNGSEIPETEVGGKIFFEASTENKGDKGQVYLVHRRKDGNRTGEISIKFPSTSGTLALQGTSGFEYKKDITDADAQEAMDRINGQRLVNFVYKDDEQERVRFGIIAEEAELIAPQYIKHNQVSYEDILDEDGNKIGEKTRDRPSVDVNPIVMDLMGCVQALTKRIEDMEAEIAELKASK